MNDVLNTLDVLETGLKCTSGLAVRGSGLQFRETLKMCERNRGSACR